MKKITRSVFALSIILSSCTKEPNWVRNYSQPHTDKVTGIQRGSNIAWHSGMSDEECIALIKTFDSYDPTKPIFLSPKVYDLSGVEESKSVSSLDAKYMLFPHSINSMSDEWGWDYLNEMNELRNNHGAEGMQIFLDKYLDGDSTLGMKLNKNF